MCSLLWYIHYRITITNINMKGYDDDGRSNAATELRREDWRTLTISSTAIETMFARC